MSASNLIHLIYISSATSWPTEDDLIRLLEQSRARNLRQHVTGMLIYDNATYMQVLEGTRPDVHEIFAAIRVDSRNNGVVKLVDEEIEERHFPNWTMGFKHLGDGKADDVPAYVDVFRCKLDKLLVMGNQSAAIRMLMHFARRGSGLRP